MLRRLTVLCLASLTLAAGLAVPANAAWWSSPDASGNVDGSEIDLGDPADPAECPTSTDIDGTHRTDLDITRLAVRHGRRDVVVTVSFAQLARRPQSIDIPILTPRSDYTAAISVNGRGRTRVFWLPHFQSDLQDALAEAEDDDCGLVLFGTDGGGCRGLSAARSLATDTVRVTVPRRCLGNPWAVRAGAEVSGTGPTDFDADRIVVRAFSDRWAPAGRDRGWRAVYGRWVQRPGR